MRERDKAHKRWHSAGITQEDAICFLGREREARRVEKAIAQKTNMMICGPADIGKTALIKHVLCTLPGETGSRCLYLGGFKNLQDLLRKLLTILYHAGNAGLRRHLHTKGVSAATFGPWLKSASSPQLKGLLYRAVEHGDFSVILDQCPPLTHAIAKVVKELFWMRGTPVYLLLRDAPKYKLDQFAKFFYWGRREQFVLAPLAKPVAAELLETCIRRFGLAQLDLDEFREEILDLSGCVPGAIVKMCAMAADRRYQSGARIKTKLAHIDYLMGGSTLPSSV